MIALGYAFSATIGNGTIACSPVSDAFVVHASVSDTTSHHSRLALGLQFFKRNKSFLPLHPKHTITLSQAALALQHIDLSEIRAHVQNHVQFTISLSKDVLSFPRPQSGRSWLAQKQHAQKGIDTDTEQLEKIGIFLAAKSANIRKTPSQIHCDLLIAKDRTDDLSGKLSQTVTNNRYFRDRTLSVTGPWHPFLFTNFADLVRDNHD